MEYSKEQIQTILVEAKHEAYLAADKFFKAVSATEFFKNGWVSAREWADKFRKK